MNHIHCVFVLSPLSKVILKNCEIIHYNVTEILKEPAVKFYLVCVLLTGIGQKPAMAVFTL